MTHEQLWVFGLLLACVAAFIVNRPRMDVVALMALVALVLGGTLSPAEALAGFSEPSVLLIAAFFIIGEGLVRTGIAYRVGDWLVHKAGSDETRLIVLMMLSVGLLGSVMSSTGVVAIFIPVALSMASRLGLAPGRLMMPLSFAALISGMLTLVATPPNLVVNSELERAGVAGFGFFSFTPVGLLALGLGIVYMLFARHWLGTAPRKGARGERPRRRMLELARDYELEGRVLRLLVRPDSPLVGRTLGELQLRTRLGLNVIGLERQRHFRMALLEAGPGRELQAGDTLLLLCDPLQVNFLTLGHEHGLESRPFREDSFADSSREMGLAEVVLPPESSLIGKTVLELGFRTRYGLHVVGLRRRRRALGTGLDKKLRMGDTLLVAGSWKAIRQLQGCSQDFLVLNLPAELDEAAPAGRRAPFAILTLLLTVGLMISGLVPPVIAAFIGCLLMGAFRCVDLESAYRAINWQCLILIVGMLPFATALQKTGGIDLVVQGLLALTGGESPRLVLASLFLLTALVGLFVSNTATAVLMAPVAIATASQLGLSPYPFAMTVAVAASAAFMTPVSSPVNTLVLVPGQYRFSDYLRLGVPFTVLLLLVCVLVLPWLFPWR
ncbi:SLC13 family permease [Azovibrio restrictus]|uniref:SLC13 family permease n=1 Tax=Azovibrio restrictus TaxID=146938 RepID=UPI0026F29FC2|nr:SLC13 family permease [Azovibrio restrictus]MDD3482010.1 SLC13 family permease [Azovibrio restrictus]